MEKIDIIKRKAVQIFSEEDLDKKLKSGKKLIIKFGADPSRPDLHIGHSVPLRVLKSFQDMGHRVVFVIGDFTAMIGDPSGKSKTRPALIDKFEKSMKIPDNILRQYFELATDLETTEIEEIMSRDIREAHIRFAKELIKMYDITADFNSIKERYLKIANGGIPTDINEVIIEESKINICDLLLKIGFSSSKSEAKRMIQGKGVKVDSKVIEYINEIIEIEKEKVIQFGKNKFLKIKI